MKTSLFLAAVFAFATSVAFAQTTPGTTNSSPATTAPPQTGTTTAGSANNGTMNSTTDRMGDMNSAAGHAMHKNHHEGKKGMKTKVNSDGSTKTKM